MLNFVVFQPAQAWADPGLLRMVSHLLLMPCDCMTQIRPQSFMVWMFDASWGPPILPLLYAACNVWSLASGQFVLIL